MEDENYKEKNIMMSFSEYIEMRTANEGLWLNDNLAVPGISKIMPPTPPKKTRPKPPPPPKLKPPHIPKSEGSLDQLQRSVNDLGKMGIGLLPPKKEDLKRLIDKQKAQVTVPQKPRMAEPGRKVYEADHKPVIGDIGRRSPPAKERQPNGEC